MSSDKLGAEARLSNVSSCYFFAARTESFFMSSKFLRTMALSCLLLISSTAANAGDASLTITFSGLRSDDGLLLMSLHLGKNSYELDDETYIADLDIKNGIASVTFDGLPSGDYAIKSFHDENRDGKLNTSIVGIPTETYAFSNDAEGHFGAPSYEAAKFSIVDGDNIHEVKYH